MIEPYYQEDGITLYCGDCREILPQFKDKEFDLVLTDPPYGIGEDGGKARTRGKKEANHERGFWDSSIPPAEVFVEMFRISENQIVFGGNYFTLYLPPSRGWIYWRKLMGGDFGDGELVWTSYDIVVREYTRPNKGLKNAHPTQKPVDLMGWILRDHGTDLDNILDPFCGVGTTLVAAKQLGRKAVGIEISEKYCEIAVKRLAQMQLEFE